MYVFNVILTINSDCFVRSGDSQGGDYDDCCLLSNIYYESENGGRKFMRNIDSSLPTYTASYHRETVTFGDYFSKQNKSVPNVFFCNKFSKYPLIFSWMYRLYSRLQYHRCQTQLIANYVHRCLYKQKQSICNWHVKWTGTHITMCVPPIHPTQTAVTSTEDSVCFCCNTGRMHTIQRQRLWFPHKPVCLLAPRDVGDVAEKLNNPLRSAAGVLLFTCNSMFCAVCA
jgi:hypothetical protein